MGRTTGCNPERGTAERRRDGSSHAVDRARRRSTSGRHISDQGIGWGGLGAAWIAEISGGPAVAASKNGRLVVIASRDLQRAQRMVVKYPGAHAAGSYEEVLS